MSKRIQVSFKENKRDLALYKYVKNKNDISCFVKDAIEYYFQCNSLGNEIKSSVYREKFDI
ncbi:hypothetical protein [Clostridium oceanicum]|uniref:Uncharacterized protein n=1 Tax=Clostridium oceanicum TaxID=1543 RepID=A0ABN1JCN0_9CLOT